MKADFTKTKYFDYLLDNSETLENDLQDFNKKFIELTRGDIDELGTVLKCHLITEYYIDQYISKSYPTVISWDKIRLNFSQKIEVINNPQTLTGIYYPALKSLNTLRNKFAHKLGYKIIEEDLIEIRTILTAWNSALGKPIPKGVKLIEEFTIWMCAGLNSMTTGIHLETPELGLSGYIKWLKKMNEGQ
jgi:hypothetical protein